MKIRTMLRKRMTKKTGVVILAVLIMAGIPGGCGKNVIGGNDGPTSVIVAENEGENTEGTETPEEMEKAADGTVYKVGIVQFVDDASLNQINRALCAELNAKGAELGVTFDYEDYNLNGQADATMLGQIAQQLLSEDVDVIVPIATPAAVIMQAAAEDSETQWYFRRSAILWGPAWWHLWKIPVPM